MAASALIDEHESSVALESRSDQSSRIETSHGRFDILCAFAVLVSAFLVFQVQPVISKMILPWFGGGPSVWTTCLLFFQLVLLAGYGYAFLLNRFLAPRRQAVTHSILVAVALLLLPITPNDAWKPIDGYNPASRILLLLLANVGLQYFLLSATAPLLQSWFARVYPGRTPYRLYALSNAGSLTALLSYPFVVEPLLATTTQGALWSAGFGLFALLCACLAVAVCRRPADERQPHESGPSDVRKPVDSLATLQHAETVLSAPNQPDDVEETGEKQHNSSAAQWLNWIGLSAYGSFALLAVTNRICQEMTVAPLLWVVPLSIYLLTFIISFDRPRWFVPRWWGIAAVIGIVATVFFRSDYLSVFDGVLGKVGIILNDFSGDIVVETALFLTSLFLVCMICHGGLVRRKPPAERLTSFYLAIATGGAVGGLTVAVVCPWLFSFFIETELTLVIGFLLAVWTIAKDGCLRWPGGKPAVYAILGATVPPVLFLILTSAWETGNQATLVRCRNFYGVFQVDLYDVEDSGSPGMALYHGRTQHGFQYLDKELRNEPTTYYNRESGVGVLLTHLADRKSLRVGIVGLGAGTLAAYGREDEFYHFYEINRDIVRIAYDSFSFLSDCPVETKITLGDARISLERQPNQDFDVMVLDAFSGDAIPMHLLTIEAFELYQRHLKPGGVIAVHVSNRYLNLFPVVAGAAERHGMNVLYVGTGKYETIVDGASDWLLMTRNDEFIDDEDFMQHVSPHEEYSSPRIVWTDQYSNLLGVLE